APTAQSRFRPPTDSRACSAVLLLRLDVPPTPESLVPVLHALPGARTCDAAEPVTLRSAMLIPPVSTSHTRPRSIDTGERRIQDTNNGISRCLPPSSSEVHIPSRSRRLTPDP